MVKTFCFSVFFFLFLQARSQPILLQSEYKFYQEKIDKAQLAVDSFCIEIHGGEAKREKYSAGEFRQTLFSGIDSLQHFIASFPAVDSSKRRLLLQGLEKALWSFGYACKAKEVDCLTIKELVDGYQAAMQLHLRDSSIYPVIRHTNLAVATILVNAMPFQSNGGIRDGKAFVVRQVFERDPQNILPVLFDNPDVPFADSLIIKIAGTQADRLYEYAQAANSDFGRRVRTIDNPLVKWIVKLSDLSSGRLVFPFLDDLLSGKISFTEIKKALDENDEVQYYRLLVRTAINYTAQMREKDLPLALDAVHAMLRQKTVHDFINKVNDLHESPDAVRLRPIRMFAPQELYYLLVMSENVIYTSSYLKIYKRMFDLMKGPDSHRLLESVQYDRYRKFIRMAANYNVLGSFLSRMNGGSADSLMKSFVNGLVGTGNLEDAVDVADSYAGISDRRLHQLLLAEVDKDLSTLRTQGNKKGAAVYKLIRTLFLSLDTGRHIDVSAAFGIPSVYSVENSFLRDSAGRIIIQQFFYGDEDGIAQYAKFVAAYKKTGWIVNGNDEWIELRPARGVPVVIYANKPLDNEAELDAKAQADLCSHLKENRLRPTVVIHRGHSYHVQYTIAQLAPSAKIVVLGSCGGFQNLSAVLRVCPAAHIISTKQVGSGRINEPLIFYLIENLRKGKDIYWPSVWHELEKKFRNNAKFADYVPPHKNLGALFLMGYKNSLEKMSGD